MDSGALYKNALVKFHNEVAPGAPAEKIANVHRIALRAFDAYTAGDEFNATSFFNNLAEEPGSSAGVSADSKSILGRALIK